VDSINQAGRLFIQFESIGTVKSIPYKYELILYNIILELIQNIIKHAEAEEAIIQLMLEPDFVSLFVEDDGKGFDKTKINTGLGYLRMEQMVRFVKGNMVIDAEPGKMCRVSIEFPLKLYERS